MTNISTGASTVVGGQTSVAVSYDLGGRPVHTTLTLVRESLDDTYPFGHVPTLPAGLPVASRQYLREATSVSRGSRPTVVAFALKRAVVVIAVS
jgi:hypothetical protein